MKKIILSALMLFSAATAFSQARKPIIMVIPSDIYCTRAGYVTTYQDESGNTQTAADYSKAFLNDENLRLAIESPSGDIGDVQHHDRERVSSQRPGTDSQKHGEPAG